MSEVDGYMGGSQSGATFEEQQALLSAWQEANDSPDPGPLKPPADEDSPIEERFPRQLLLKFVDCHADPTKPETCMFLLEATPNAFPDGPIQDYRGSGKSQGFAVGQLGDSLTDRSYSNDGYRFHDALHLAFMAILGYSPTIRSLLNLRRQSDEQTYKIDDGPRAILQEESMFNKLGMGRAFTSGLIIPNTYRVEFAIEEGWNMDKVTPPGVGVRLREWERALMIGSRLFCLLANTIGKIRPKDYKHEKRYPAWVYLDLDQKAVRFSLDGAKAVKEVAPLQPTTKLFFTDGRPYDG